MSTDTSPAKQVAKALGLSLDVTAKVEEYSGLMNAIDKLVVRCDHLVIPNGRSSECIQDAERLRAKITARVDQLRAAQKQALRQVSRGGPIQGVPLAVETLTADPIKTARTELIDLLDSELETHRKKVELEDETRRTATALTQRAELLLIELRRLVPGQKTLLEQVETLLDQAGTDIAKGRYTEAKEQAQQAIAQLAKVPDPLRDLPTTEDTSSLVEKISTLKHEILTSPLTGELQTELLDRLTKAGETLRSGDSEQAQTLTDQIQTDFEKAVVELDNITARFKGLLETAERALNTLSLLAKPSEYVDLQVPLESLRGQLGRVNQKVYDQLVSLVTQMEERKSEINAAFEEAAQGLAKLEGFVKKVTDLRTWLGTVETPFAFSVSLEELLADQRELQDSVHSRAIQAHELAPKVKELLDGLEKNQEAKEQYDAIKDKIKQAVAQVKEKTATVEQSLKTLIRLANTPIEEVPSPDEGSIQYYQAQLDKLGKAWDTAVANAWKSGDIDPAPTLDRLGELQTAIEQCDPKTTIDRTKLETARAAYRKARQAALDLVGKAVAQQSETDTEPGDILVAINKIDLSYQKAEKPEQIETCTERQNDQRKLLESFISGQQLKITLAKNQIAERLAAVSRKLEEIDKAGTPSVFYPKRRARVTKEKKYAAFLGSTLVPELKLFEGAELVTVLYDALRRVLDLEKDVKAIYASVVEGEPLEDGEGKTFDAVSQKLDLVRVKLNDGNLKKYRSGARAKFLERLKEIEDLAYERPMEDTIAELNDLLDNDDGIPVAIREANMDAEKRAEFDNKLKAIKKKLKSNSKLFSQKFSSSDLEDARRDNKVPDAKNAKAYVQDLAARLANLTKLSKEEGEVSDTLPKLDELEREIDEAIADPKKRVEKVQAFESTEKERKQNREQFDTLWENARFDALKMLERDAGSKKQKNLHIKEVERDFKAAKAAFEASGKLEDAEELIQSAKEKAEFYGLGAQEAKAKYARKDLEEHRKAWSTNVGAFVEAVERTLVEVIKKATEDPKITLGEVTGDRVAAVIGKLKVMFDKNAFNAPITELVQHMEASDKRKARAVREAALARIRAYQALVDGDPDILLLDMAPTGGFGHASAALKRTLMMLERTFLVSVPEGE